MILCVLLVAIFVSAFTVRHKLEKRTLKQILYYLPMLHSMIGQMQKHRGLNASFLQGKSEAISAIKSVQHKLEQISRDLERFTILTEMERWDAYLDHWSRLVRNHQNLSVAESFTQHTALIENALYLLEDLANTTQSLSKIETDSNHVTLLWRELPLLVEFVGQTRAIGMPIVTKQEMNQIDKIKLGYLRDKVDKTSSIVFDALLKDTQNSKQSHVQLESAISVCGGFITTLDREFLKTDKITLASDDYFEIASNVMNSINEILHFEMDKFTQNT
nr:nitrate- and nitrite sensing domain-containing protein [Alteromonas sp. 5E99-2]